MHRCKTGVRHVQNRVQNRVRCADPERAKQRAKRVQSVGVRWFHTSIGLPLRLGFASPLGSVACATRRSLSRPKPHECAPTGSRAQVGEAAEYPQDQSGFAFTSAPLTCHHHPTGLVPRWCVRALLLARMPGVRVLPASPHPFPNPPRVRLAALGRVKPTERDHGWLSSLPVVPPIPAPGLGASGLSRRSLPLVDRDPGARSQHVTGAAISTASGSAIRSPAETETRLAGVDTTSQTTKET